MLRLSLRNGILVLCALSVTALAGCTEPSGINANMTRATTSTSQSISVSRLADDLGLSLEKQSSSYAMLRDSNDVVMVYPNPDGQIYVNGQPVGRSGCVFVEQGEFYVPYALEGQIRSMLHTAQPTITPRPRMASYVQPPSALVPVRPTPRHTGARASGDVVVIDPGHGGKDPGTTGVSRMSEKCIVLDVGLKLARDLQARGADVTMTRNDDTFIELDDRPAVANHLHAALFVAVHADSAPRPSARGFTVYVSPSASASSIAAAESIERSMMAAGFPSNGVKRARYRVLVRSDGPAVLVELGYLTNGCEAAALCESGQRSAYAQAISEGVVQFLNSH